MNPTSKKNILVLAALGAAALAAASYGAYWWHTGRFMQTTDDAYVGGDISAISSKVSGYIQQLAVQDNMAVKKGDLLIRIDDRDYRAALAKAAGEVAAQQAALADIQATRQLQQATIAGSAASLLAATAATEKLANDNRRYNALAASSAISAQIRDNASADYRRAHAEQEKAKADKTVAERQLAVLDARQQQILAALAQAQANLEMARLNLSYTDIRAPFDGVIGNRRAWSGSFVSSGTQLLSLVPAHGLWIDANFKEKMNPTSKKNILVLAALGAAALAAASYGVYWWHTGRFMQTTDDAYVGGDISAISSKVSGYIQQLAVQDNMAVKKGDLLIRIDDRDYRAALAKAAGEVAAQQAALADIQATRQLQQATIAGSAASLLAATAATEKLANDNRRYNALAASSAISAQIRDNASADYRRAHAEQEKAKADKTVAERQLAVLDARQQQILAALAQAQANLEMARLNLSYTDIRAPFDGVIGNRRAWSGSFVSSGTQLLSLVPAHGLWIDANFKENQLAHMRAGQPVTIVADVLPNHTFKGHVASLAPATGSRFSILPAENATGNFTKIVQRVPVRIALEGDGAKLDVLRPGLSVIVTVNEKSPR